VPDFKPDKFERRLILVTFLTLVTFLVVTEQISYGRIDPQLVSILVAGGTYYFARYTTRGKDKDDDGEDGEK
jgi:hypothetical protein